MMSKADCELSITVAEDNTLEALFTHRQAGLFERWKYRDTMSTVGKVLTIAKERCGVDLRDGEVVLMVDSDGLGKGLSDKLVELGVNVVEFKE